MSHRKSVRLDQMFTSLSRAKIASTRKRTAPYKLSWHCRRALAFIPSLVNTPSRTYVPEAFFFYYFFFFSSSSPAFLADFRRFARATGELRPTWILIYNSKLFCHCTGGAALNFFGAAVKMRFLAGVWSGGAGLKTWNTSRSGDAFDSELEIQPVIEYFKTCLRKSGWRDHFLRWFFVDRLRINLRLAVEIFCSPKNQAATITENFEGMVFQFTVDFNSVYSTVRDCSIIAEVNKNFRTCALEALLWTNV